MLQTVFERQGTGPPAQGAKKSDAKKITTASPTRQDLHHPYTYIYIYTY